MPHRLVAARELSLLMGVLAHPERIWIVEELKGGERDVASLHEELGVAQTKVSKHLAVLRAHRVVTERRVGRHVYYRLVQPEMAGWVAAGLGFVRGAQAVSEEIAAATEASMAQWIGEPD